MEASGRLWKVSVTYDMETKQYIEKVISCKTSVNADKSPSVSMRIEEETGDSYKMRPYPGSTHKDDMKPHSYYIFARTDESYVTEKYRSFLRDFIKEEVELELDKPENCEKFFERMQRFGVVGYAYGEAPEHIDREG